LLAITASRVIVWPNTSFFGWLVFAYDWDSIILKNDTAALASNPLSLCFENMPCALQIRGEKSAVVEISGQGQVACSISSGCSSISIYSVAFICSRNERSAFRMQGSSLNLRRVSFAGCSSNTDGGVVWAYDKANIFIDGCSFADLRSWGFGGAVAAHGSNLSVVDSHLRNCSSHLGGGAVWASAFPDCFNANETANSFLFISSSSFSLCTSGGAGGAIFLNVPTSVKAGVIFSVHIAFTRFESCSSAADGGALFASGNLYMSLISTIFDSCLSDAAGGALSAIDGSWLSILDCTMKANTAWGIGGGALHMSRCYFAAHNTSISSNSAPNGGGGAVMWEDWIRPAYIDCPTGTEEVNASCAAALAPAFVCSFSSCVPSTSSAAAVRFDAASTSTADAYSSRPHTPSTILTTFSKQFNLASPNAASRAPLHSYSSLYNDGAVSDRAARSSRVRRTGCTGGFQLCAEEIGILGNHKKNSSDSRSSAGRQVAPGLKLSLQPSLEPSPRVESVRDLEDKGQAPGAEDYEVPGAEPELEPSPLGEGVLRLEDRSQAPGADDDESKYERSTSSCSLEQRRILSALDRLKLNTLQRLESFFSLLTVHTETYSVQDAVHLVLKGKDIHSVQRRTSSAKTEKGSKAPIESSWRKTAGVSPSAQWPDAPDEEKYYLLAANRSEWRETFAPFDMQGSLCKGNNTALFGDCLASGFWELQVPKSLSTYSGGTVAFTVLKKDAYNQTMLSDSLSVLQIHSSLNGSGQVDPSISLLGTTYVELKQGAATLQIQIEPTYSAVKSVSGTTVLQTAPFVYLDGQDKQAGLTTMRSSAIPVALSSGFTVCPRGYILAFKTANVFNGSALCQRCPAGTYSVSPLASRDGLSNANPACLNCPAGASCLQGGSDVKFILGNWTEQNEQYRLVHCPPGTQLVSSTSGASSGPFSHDAQQCKPCQIDEYILDPDNDVCRKCPPGLICDGTDVVVAKVNGSMWTRNGSIYLLQSCPFGHRISNSGLSGSFDSEAQQCSVCPRGQECISAPCTVCTPCQPDFYKPADGADPCTPCPTNMYNTLFAAESLSACQPCPSGALCPDNSCALRNTASAFSSVSCSTGLKIAGNWNLDNSSGRFQLLDCPDGYLQNSDQCQVCPASFFCSGGLSTPCPTNYFSLPRSSNAVSCRFSVFVVVTINVPMSRPLFYQTDAFQRALASFASVDHEYVLVDAIQAGRNPATTDVTSKIASSSASVADVLVKMLREADDTSFELMLGSSFKGTSLTTIKVTSCIPGYEMQSQPPPSTCQLCPANYFCLGDASGRTPCPRSGFSNVGANASSSCTQYAVEVAVTLPISKVNFTIDLQTAFLRAVAITANILPERVSVVFLADGGGSVRRDVLASLQVSAQISAVTAAEASALASKIDSTTLNANLEAAGLPKFLSMTASEKSSVSSQPSSSAGMLPYIIGGTFGGLILLVVSIVGGNLLAKWYQQFRAHNAFVAAVRDAKAGQPASMEYLPPDILGKNGSLSLRAQYIAEEVLGKGRNGCVVKARRKKVATGSTKDLTREVVAIKIVIPRNNNIFDERERMMLQQEAEILHAVTLKNSRSIVHYVQASELTPQRTDVCWFITEALGTPASTVCPVSHTECIQISRDVLAALKILHGEGWVHADVNPTNIVKGTAVRDGYEYKLIDFGSVLQVGTVDEHDNQVLTGVPGYRSPEMFVRPCRVTVQADLWSLGVSMLELASAHMPFGVHGDSDADWCSAIARYTTADLHDAFANLQSQPFDPNLTKVIAKAIQKDPTHR
jgi:hypothetical protein